ncbi:MAG: PVC-type heme-binding CxxCH protein [Planctomycetota bacterium]|nr:PVC-type heme-binding CxxCH protein [Planctomycetota bacterium]
MIASLLIPVIIMAQESVPQSDPSRALQAVDGMIVETWAETPDITDPVAFCIDDQGRVYVAESFRQEHGVEDNRSQPYWLLDDLAAIRIEDRMAKYEKWAHKRDNGMQWYTEMEDRVRLLEDTDGDRRADRATIFADGFNDVLDGTGAGLIVNGDEVWYACIPHLWRLKDEDGDGLAETRQPIYTGFGVRDALRGHDMHGFAWGPDGRMYWSLGDRGYYVETADGRILEDPRSGAVFRCEPDGSNLEIFCTGLRNPQELAFDRYGYLFTGDNNSDGGDRARIVYCAEAGETGWEMNYQTLGGDNNRGPWMQEGLCQVDHPGRPVWSLPPLKHVGSGPSGFTFYPGQGLSDRYDDHFFMCNFLGGAKNSGVIAMEMVPDGAGFRVEDVHDFVKGVLCTDVDFDWDGSMLISDWVEGWESTHSGRLFRLHDRVHGEHESLQATADLVASGFDHLEQTQLIMLLAHADRRVRRRAHYELAHRGPRSVELLAVVAGDPDADQMARIHAIWALGIIARHHSWDDGDQDHPLEALRLIAWDEDDEVRAQVARVLGEASYEPAGEDLLGLVFDESPRVVYYATMGLGRLGNPDSIDAIVEMIWANENKDPWLRHAGVVALVRIGDRARLLELLGDPMPSVRLASLLALRRLKDPAVALVLRDADPLIAAEAARAINDVPIIEGQEALADLLPTLISNSSRQEPVYQVVWDVYEDVPPLSPDDLATHEMFSRDPDMTREITGFMIRSDEQDQYASRMTGRVVPSTSGSHRFSITSDDASVLFGWPEGRPGQRQRLAEVRNWTPLNVWSAETGQVSEPVELNAGEAWILEARHCDGSGLDHLAIGWQLPDGTWERPIGATPPDPTASAVARRSLAAAMRSGEPARAEMVAAFAMDETQPDVLRREAMETLRQWPAPEPRERVQGRYRPVEAARDVEGWKVVMTRVLPSLAQSDDVIAQPARQIATEHEITLDSERLLAALDEESSPVDRRISMLRLLVRDESARSRAIEKALASSDPTLRSEGIRLVAQWDPERAMPIVLEGLESSELSHRRAAIESLAILPGDQVVDLLQVRLSNLDQEHPALALDIVEAARARGGDHFQKSLAAWTSMPEEGYPPIYSLSSSGGDAVRGRELVFYHASASCLRCHVIEGAGGTAGPSLGDVARRLDEAALLRSLLEPQAEIAEGYGEASAMPAMAKHLNPMEVRDIVAYLRTLRGSSN